MRHPDFAVPLSLEFSFVRRIGEEVELEPLSVRPLKILVVICEPITSVEFGGRRFHDVIVKESSKLAEESFLQLEFLKLPSTPNEFSRRVLEDCPDVIHFIGHGNVGVLSFEDDYGDESDVTTEKFYSLFTGAKKPRLVILTACFSGAVSGRDFISGTATALVKAGIPSVFAMQLPIGIESAYELVGDLYAGLLKTPFDGLVRSLRASRFFAERVYAPAQWGIPVFYLQCRSEQLFHGVSKEEGYSKRWPDISPTFGLPELGLFVGRKDYLSKMSRSLKKSNIVVLDGLSGIGKSALARKFCHWHGFRGSFLGGIIWVDLRASKEIKLTYETVLEKIAVALKVPMERVRDRLGLESTLLVLDSYEALIDDEKLASFLVNIPKGSKAILTTFKSVDFGESIRIEEMKERDAIEYFWRRALMAGWDGKTGSDLIPEICKVLGYMPLCIELVAPMAKKSPIGDLLKQVEDLKVISAKRRDLPKHHWSIETALRVSYGSLNLAEQRLLAIASVFSGRFFSRILARIADLSEPDTLRLVGNLFDSGLVNFDGKQYHLHTMVRIFASERLGKDFKEKEKYEKKFAEFYYALCGSAAEMLDKGKESRTAVNMALMESLNLLLAQEILFKKEELDKAFIFSMTLESLFDRAGLWQSRIKVAQVAVKIAKQRKNENGLSEAYSRLGIAYFDNGQTNKGLYYFRKSLKISERIGDKLAKANLLGNIAIVFTNTGRFEKALKNHKKCLELHREIGSKLGEAKDYLNMGNTFAKIRKFKEALKSYKKSLRMAKEVGNKFGEAVNLSSIGSVFSEIGRFREALRNHQEGLEIYREIGDRDGEAIQLGNIGNVFNRMGKFEKALENYQKSLEIYREIGDQDGEATILLNIGFTFLKMGRPEAFVILLKAAYLFHKMNIPLEPEIKKMIKKVAHVLPKEALHKILEGVPKFLKTYYEENIKQT